MPQKKKKKGKANTVSLVLLSEEQASQRNKNHFHHRLRAACPGRGDPLCAVCFFNFTTPFAFAPSDHLRGCRVSPVVVPRRHQSAGQEATVTTIITMYYGVLKH